MKSRDVTIIGSRHFIHHGPIQQTVSFDWAKFEIARMDDIYQSEFYRISSY
jgi:hypothetical protein